MAGVGLQRHKKKCKEIILDFKLRRVLIVVSFLLVKSPASVY